MGFFSSKKIEEPQYSQEFEDHFFTFSIENVSQFGWHIRDAIYVEGSSIDDLKKYCFKNGYTGIIGLHFSPYLALDSSFSGSGCYYSEPFYYGTAIKIS